MKCDKRSSICCVAFGKRSLYNVFIIAISLSTIGDLLGELRDRDRGLLKGDRRPASPSRPLWVFGPGLLHTEPIALLLGTCACPA